MTTEPLLKVDELTVTYPLRHETLVAVDDISFDINRGEILGLVGETGAGKSVTGAAIIGLLSSPGRVTAGRIFFDGKRIDNLPRRKRSRLLGRHIGAIFQDPWTSLDPLFPIGHQLVETLRTHLPLSMVEAKERAVDWLTAVGIPAPRERCGQYPHQLSGGMRQRVVIALGLCAGPDLVIADEPTTALDVSVQAQVIGLLRRLCREQGTTVLLITHDMGVIAEATDRVVVMYGGQILEIGETATVMHSPSHPYTRGLMESVPRIGAERGHLSQIAGNVPRHSDLPPGCVFFPRCNSARPHCEIQRPALFPVKASEDAPLTEVACETSYKQYLERGDG